MITFIIAELTYPKYLPIKMRLNLKGFIAWIEVDGSVAQQYEEIISNDRLTIRCWIASEVGEVRSFHCGDALAKDIRQEFRVCWKKPDSWKTVLVGGVNVDGIQCGGTICYKDDKKPISMSGFTTTNESNRPFTFADLELTGNLLPKHHFLPNSYLGMLRR